MADEGSDVPIELPPPGPVVIAVDASFNSEYAVHYYLERYHRPEYKIVIVHCIELNYAPTYPVREEVASNIMLRARESARDVTQKYVEIFKQKGIHGEVVSDFGHPGELLVKTAEDKHAQLVVMGTRGMGTIRRTLVGSISDYVIHHVHCPTLVARMPHHYVKDHKKKS